MMMDIKEALKVTGFQLCEFKSDGDWECSTCDETIPEGADVYYERTCYEVDEGEYHCTDCTLAMPAKLEEDRASIEEYYKSEVFQ
jgi:hypothetical protein